MKEVIMSRFEMCPKLTFEKCKYYDEEKCEGCPIYTAYYIGRADATEECLAKMRGDKE